MGSLAKFFEYVEERQYPPRDYTPESVYIALITSLYFDLMICLFGFIVSPVKWYTMILW